MANLNVKVGLDRSGFQTGLAAMENAVSRFGGRLTAGLAAAVGIGSIGALVKQAINLAGQLDDLSERFNAPLRGLQLLGNAAVEKGSDIEAVGQAFKFLGKNAQEAARLGSGDLVKAFAAIGVSGAELRSLRPDELFLKLSDAFKAGRLTGQEFAVTAKLLGRGFEQLLPVLRLGSDEIRRLGESKGIMSDAAVRQLAAVEDFLKKINNLTKVMTGEVTFGFIKSFRDFLREAPTGSPANALMKTLFGESRAPAGRRSGGSRITELNAGADEEKIRLLQKLDTDEARFELKLIEARIDGRRSAQKILQDFEDQAAQDEIQKAERRAQDAAEARRRIEDIEAERSGTTSELLRRRAQEAISLANQTGSDADRLAALEARQAFEQTTRQQIEGSQFFKLFGGDAVAQARAAGDALGNIRPMSAALSDTAGLGMQSKTEGPKAQTVEDIRNEVRQAVDKLDALIRASGTFTL